jgi:hypothetical protein
MRTGKGVPQPLPPTLGSDLFGALPAASAPTPMTCNSPIRPDRMSLPRPRKATEVTSAVSGANEAFDPRVVPFADTVREIAIVIDLVGSEVQVRSISVLLKQSTC